MEVLLYHTKIHQVTSVTIIHANMYDMMIDTIYGIVVTINRLPQ